MENSQEKITSLFDSFQKALLRLKEMAKRPKEEATRDSVIQRFEFCFELAWKLLHAILQDKNLEAYGPKDTIRVSASANLLDDSPKWFEFLAARNLATHTYNEDMSEEVYEKAKEFIPEGEKLIETLKANILVDSTKNLEQTNN